MNSLGRRVLLRILNLSGKISRQSENLDREIGESGGPEMKVDGSYNDTFNRIKMNGHGP